MKVLLPGITEPWDLVVFGGGFGFSRSFFLVINTSHNNKRNSTKETPIKSLKCQLEVSIGISILLIACVGSYLSSSIPGPPETQPMRPLTFSPATTPKCWCLVGSQFNFFNCPKSCLHLCLLNFKFLSHLAKRRCFHFKRRLQIGFDLFFTTESVKTHPLLFELS
jgi:hypothetical protein